MTSAAWVHEAAGREAFSWCHYTGGTLWLCDTHFTEPSSLVICLFATRASKDVETGKF